MAGNAGGAFTGLYQGGGGAADASAALKPLLPNISIYSQGSSSAPALQNQVTVPLSSYSGGGALSNFEHFLGGLGSQIGHLAGGAVSWLGHNALNMVEAPVKLGEGIGHGITDRLVLDDIQKQNQQISGKIQSLAQQYKSGAINKKEYVLGLKEIGQDSTQLSKESAGMVNKVTLDQKASTEALINTASGLITIMATGAVPTGVKIGAEGVALQPAEAKTAADWLTSKVTNTFFEPAVTAIQKVAANPEVFKALDSTTQQILQRSTAEVVAQSANMTAGQIARTTAVNLALKYPIYFNYLSSTAGQVYHELDQKKYGDAIRTLAFNAALVLSGGPIGQAIKYGGKTLGGITERTFGQTSFWDELSKYYGDQTTSGFARAIAKQANAIEDPVAKSEFIKNLAAVEATNVNAAGDAIAAAARVARGMRGTYGFDLTTVSHDQAITDMVNYAKNFRIANEVAEGKGLGQLAIGRVDARDLNSISAKLSPLDGPGNRLQMWEELKAQNPNQAWANNVNFDRQIKDIIAVHEDPASLDNAIRNIRAQFSVPGFPESVAKQMAKEGYFPIKPTKLEAPFKEGGDKLLTAHGNEDFFIKTVQPLPVLGSVGALFTGMGLSPQASGERVYQYFNDYLSKNLESSGVISKIQGEDIQQTSDVLVKRLSDYAHGLKVPETDLRMLTNKQIRTALGTSRAEASNVQQAIARAYIQVPLAVRGLGDRAVDWTYGLPGSSSLMRRYLRIQGALRFSFNPFFQYLRVIPKTEMLSEAEGGGYVSSIFAGRAQEIEDIRQGLRAGGLLDQVGHLGNVDSAEAVDYAGFVGRNLNKKLLPMQERSIAGLIDSQAQRMGMDWRDYVAQYPHQARDTIQMIAEYDRKSSFLNSPLARTLNIAIFPFRFDTKVAMIFGRSLARSDLLTQVAVVNGMFKAHDFLNSPEGKAWYSKNADAIGLFKYITPIASLNEAFQSLLPGHDHSLGNFGELGGLPFGWIPQILDSEGLTNFNQPGVDAKTGNMIPNYVPKTAKGQMAIAVQDFLGMLFSYPGATVGLPSKTSITRNFALGLTGADKKTDLSLTTPEPNAQQKEYQQSIQKPLPPESSQSPSPNTLEVTPTSPSAASKIQPKIKSSSKKLKKSDYPVMLPPGQTQAGVL